jgi:hypothetical protein
MQHHQMQLFDEHLIQSKECLVDEYVRISANWLRMQGSCASRWHSSCVAIMNPAQQQTCQ